MSALISPGRMDFGHAQLIELMKLPNYFFGCQCNLFSYNFSGAHLSPLPPIFPPAARKTKYKLTTHHANIRYVCHISHFPHISHAPNNSPNNSHNSQTPPLPRIDTPHQPDHTRFRCRQIAMFPGQRAPLSQRQLRRCIVLLPSLSRTPFPHPPPRLREPIRGPPD